MRLKSLNISEERSWSDTPSPLVGTVEFRNDGGKIQLNLTQEHLKGILAVVADALVASTKDLAANLTASAVNAIEHNSDAKKLEAPIDDLPF